MVIWCGPFPNVIQQGAWPKRTMNSWRSRARSAAVNGAGGMGMGMVTLYHARRSRRSRFGHELTGSVSASG